LFALVLFLAENAKPGFGRSLVESKGKFQVHPV